MTSRHRFVNKKVLVALIAHAGAALWLCSGVPACAEYDDMKVLEMFYEDKELVVTPSRDPKPISQVAENIDIITAREIEAIGAHTLADVLLHVPGVQIDLRGGPGVPANAFIQGSEARHVLVVIDGVTFNTLSDNVADIALIPVQLIQRVEIIKGPASSAWGSSLGGVINVITRNPDDSRRMKGFLSASVGERTTGDFRGEMTGTTTPFSYYLFAGGLTSDGLRTNTAVDQGSGYAKLHWELSDSTSLLFTLGYIDAERGVGEGFNPAFRTRDDTSYLFPTLALSSALTDRLDLDLSVRGSRRRATLMTTMAQSGSEVSKSSFEENDLGASAKLTWRWRVNQIVAGVDYDNGTLESDGIKNGEKTQERVAVFANDTIAVGPVAVIPGIRYDRTGTNGDFVSPSIGVTCSLGESTILRFYAARGFSTPPLSYTFGNPPNPGLKVEKVWSYQAGMETTALRYLWFRTTFFRNDIRDVLDIDTGSGQFVNRGSQRRQGIEGEIKTVPILHTSLLAGATFIDAENRTTGDTIKGIPRYTYNLGADFSHPDWFTAALRGRYIWWNAPSEYNGRYSSIVWDLNLSKKVLTRDNLEMELFLGGHNLFNGSQYLFGVLKNPERWFEGGVRFRF